MFIQVTSARESKQFRFGSKNSKLWLFSETYCVLRTIKFDTTLRKRINDFLAKLCLTVHCIWRCQCFGLMGIPMSLGIWVRGGGPKPRGYPDLLDTCCFLRYLLKNKYRRLVIDTSEREEESTRILDSSTPLFNIRRGDGTGLGSDFCSNSVMFPSRENIIKWR